MLIIEVLIIEVLSGTVAPKAASSAKTDGVSEAADVA